MNETNEKPKQYQCRHIFTDGHRSATPGLRGEHFCYYHHTTRKPIANPKQRRSRRTTFHLPLPEDRSAVQHSIGQIIQRLAANDLDPRRAGLLLYALQIASSNLPKDPAAKAQSPSQPAPQTVEEITLDPTHGPLAPPAELNTNPTRRRSFAELLMEKLEANPRAWQEEEAQPEHPPNTPSSQQCKPPNPTSSPPSRPQKIPQTVQNPSSQLPQTASSRPKPLTVSP